MFRTGLAHRFAHALLGAALLCGLAAPLHASEFLEPWKRPDRALVIDAYEYNSIDWQKLSQDKRVVGFINKASDGLAPAYFCSGGETEVRLCKALWKRHAVARELFQTRRTVAKTLGLKWGAYHLARPGNPIAQADNFIEFADPAPDELIALDIEDNDPTQWMSLDDAELFVQRIRARTGRYPVLYTNDVTASHIAQQRDRYRLLSRLPLWYARYKPDIAAHFPKGNWQGYTLWQFAAQANCNRRSCPYRVPGTPNDIDVNVAALNAEDLRAAWPFGGLVDILPDMMASIPVPISRLAALAGPVELQFAAVELPRSVSVLNALYAATQATFATLVSQAMAAETEIDPADFSETLKEDERAPVAEASATDPVVTRSVVPAWGPPPAARFDRSDLPVFILKRPDGNAAAETPNLF